MPIKPFSARHTVDDLGDTFRINIPSRKQWFLILFMGFWLIGWIVGEVSVSGIFFGGQSSGVPDYFLLVWLGGWTVGGAWVIYILAWLLFGKEIIEVTNQAIITNRVVLGLGFPKEYSIEHIKALRVSQNVNTNDMYGWSRTGRLIGLSGGFIAFDYGSKTINFGSGIDEAEAKQILTKITQRLSQYRSRNHQD